MSDAAAISAFNAAVDADRFARARERELVKRIEALERAVTELQAATIAQANSAPKSR